MKNLVILTGAGISAESGIQTFRATNGLWNNHPIDDVATPMGWLKNPALVLEFYNTRRKEVLNAQPNDAHKKIVDFEKNYNVQIVTQNVDDLHERAGSKNIIHLHGEILKSKSNKYPELVYDCKSDINIGDKCEKGSQLRPDVVWFGESVPNIGIAEYICSQSDYFVIIGTSLQVYPAAALVSHVPNTAHLIIIDPSPYEFKSELKFKSVTVIKEKATEGILYLEAFLENQIKLDKLAQSS